MNSEAELELQMAGLQKRYDYSQFAHDNHINVLPQEAVDRLIQDVFNTIATVLKTTYGPFGSFSLLTETGSDTTSTKDGYKVFQNLSFSHSYKQLVYNTLSKIIDRVNKNVGDGTTSCILLAEKLFRHFKQLEMTPNDKRNLVSTITDIANYLQSEVLVNEDIEDGFVAPLTKVSLRKLMLVAADYDEKLVNALFEALDPQEENNVVTSLRNVIPSAEVVTDSGVSDKYTIDFMPGDFRIGIKADYSDVVKFNEKQRVRVVIYDHNMTASDVKGFFDSYDDKPTIILAQGFGGFNQNKEFAEYMNKKEFMKRAKSPGDTNINISLIEARGYYKLNDLQDLAFLLGTRCRGIYDGKINSHEMLPEVEVSIYHADCLAFYGLKGVDTTEYIKKLEVELENDDHRSITRVKNFNDRIRALKMETSDTLINIKCSSPMEAKLLEDKVDDCICIAASAQATGIVPNLFKYGRYRINDYKAKHKDAVSQNVTITIREAIEEIFEDIYKSKFGDDYDAEIFDMVKNEFFTGERDTSYNIITDEVVDMYDIPTSAQYDLEVLVAVLEIVKYLLTPGMLIFDAHMLRPVTDEGRYQ